MQALVCYNPFSGKQKFERHLNYVVKNLKLKYEKVDVFRSLYAHTITHYIISFASNYDLLVVVGGDGSLNEAVNGLMNIKKKPVLAYIPMGTVNDVGHMLKLKKNIKGVVKIILEGHSTKMDICKIEDKYFAYGCGIGKFTNVSYDIPLKLKKKFGRMAYFIEAAKHLQITEQMNLEILANDVTIMDDFYVVLALNSRRIAGFKPHRHIKPKLNDGVIDLTLISKAKLRLSIFNLIFFFLFGEHYKLGFKNLRISNCKIISDEEVAYNVDGEYAFKKKEVNIEVCKQAIDIIINKKIAKKYF